MNLYLIILFIAPAALADVTTNLAHVNDIHAHFEQVSESTGRCHEEEAENGECYGGMSRMYTLINDLRANHDNFLLMNAGDYYSGSIWSDQLQYEPIIELGNELYYDAFAFGNHEFDDGLELVADFASRVNYPIIAANMIETPVEGVPELGEVTINNIS